MNPSRRTFMHLATGTLAFAAIPRPASAQTYPTRPVHLIVGQPPGTAPDTIARLVGAALAERLGQPFVIENRPGAGTNIATEFVVHAPPDGYTLLLASLTNAINASLYDNLRFDFVRDIAPVAPVGNNPFVMVVTPSLPAKTVADFIAYAKANPGKITMASAGSGTAPHVFGELFEQMAQVELVHVPYRGSFYPDLIAGRAQVAFISVAGSIALIKAGKLRGLAVTTATPSYLLPDLPPMNQFVPGYEATAWLGIAAPSKAPADIIARLNAALGAFSADPKIRSRLLALGVEPMTMTPAAFGKFIVEETEKWAKVVKSGAIKPD